MERRPALHLAGVLLCGRPKPPTTMKFAFRSRFQWLLASAPALVMVFLAGCHGEGLAKHRPAVATSSSYLEAAARDLLGSSLDVLRLAEPGTCPGHFDIRPSQTSQLRQCRIMLRFDFQRALDSKLAGSGAPGPIVAEISMPGGMCHPESYLAACSQIARQMQAVDLLTKAEAERRLQAIESRIHALSRDLTNRVRRAGVTGRTVLASGRQRDFCQWLGLKVVATFRSANATTMGEIEDAIQAGQVEPRPIVIANLPEGRRVADALGDRLKAPVVVFENFPAARQGHVTFDDMIAANVEALLRAAAR